MPKIEEYRRQLKGLTDWGPYLRANSGLPGPRGNLELAQAVAELASKEQTEELLAIPAHEAPENSAAVFLVFCGITALGKLAARGEHQYAERLRPFASDTRWRVREAVAIALQYIGDEDTQTLLAILRGWVKGNWYEKRAVAAAMAEPRLLRKAETARAALKILDRITNDIAASKNRIDESFKVLRQSMGYCWSVVVVACPAEGMALMEKWLSSADPDVRWIIKENLKKNRLVRMDSAWVLACRRKLNAMP